MFLDWLCSWKEFKMNFAIDDYELKPGVYYHAGINALAIVSDDKWYCVGAEDYPLYGWKRIGDL